MGATATTGLLSVPAFGNTRARPIALDPRKAEPTAPRIETATEVKQITADYMLLVVQEDSIRYYIDNSDATREEKRKAHENFGDLKRTFPLRTVKDGNVTRYELAEGAKTHPDDEDTKKFQQVSRVFGDGASGYGDDGPSLQHHPSLHRTMTKSAGDEMGLPSEIVYTTKEYADDPDNPTVDLGVPDSIAHWTNIDEGLENFISDVIHHVGQYYNPDPGWSYSYLCDHNSTYHDGSDDVTGIGGARVATEYHFDKADNNSGETEEQWVGRLTHFPEDIGQPLHTGMAWQQANLDIKYSLSTGFYVTIDPMYWLHYGYEDYVRDYWDGDWYAFHENFDDNDDCSGSCYYYYETYGDGYRVVNYLADFSHQYSETVYKTVLEEDGTRDPSYWSLATHDNLRQPTQDCLHQTGRWVRGCLHRYYG